MNNDRRRERYRTDPEFRERKLAQQKARLPQILKQRQLRYRHDEAYRELCKARANAYHARKRGEA